MVRPGNHSRGWPRYSAAASLHSIQLPLASRIWSEDVRTDGEGDARVEEVAGVHDDGGAAATAPGTSAEGGEQIVDGAMTFQQVHVLNSAEVAGEGCGHMIMMGTSGLCLRSLMGDLGAELARAEMVVEHGDVNLVQKLRWLPRWWWRSQSCSRAGAGIARRGDAG